MKRWFLKTLHMLRAVLRHMRTIRAEIRALEDEIAAQHAMLKRAVALLTEQDRQWHRLLDKIQQENLALTIEVQSLRSAHWPWATEDYNRTYGEDFN